MWMCLTMTPATSWRNGSKTGGPTVSAWTSPRNLSRLLTTVGRDLVPGTNVQAYDAGLQSISGLTTAANRMIYTTASDTYAVATLTSLGRNLLDDTSQGAMQSTLGLVPGTNVQAYSARLADVAALAVTNSNFIVGNGTNWVAETPATARTSLGLGTWATKAQTVSTSDASGTPAAGDVWLKYTA